MKLWAGRFQKETDTQVNDFNSSILFDQRMYKQDIQGSLAHATMLGRQVVLAVSFAVNWCRWEFGNLSCSTLQKPLCIMSVLSLRKDILL